MFGDMDLHSKARTIDKVLAFSFVVITYSGFGIRGLVAVTLGLIKLFS
jgi:hypothetical protein